MTAMQSPQIANTTMQHLMVRFARNTDIVGLAKAKYKRTPSSAIVATMPIVTFPNMQKLVIQHLGSSMRAIKPFIVGIEIIDDGFVASFDEANINASGDSLSEALDNLKAMIVDLYQLFSEEKDHLGPEPLRQYAVLQNYISY